jgi:triosephosphate isomerase
MSNKSRKYLIAGNWKMNLNAAEGVELAKELHQLHGQQTDVSVCVCPALTGIDSVSKVLSDSNIALGAQNMHQSRAGAFTGEVSAEMLRHLFCNYVIIGHSERREYYSETDSLVNQKTLAALAANLKPIVCVGETLEEREAGEVDAVIGQQVKLGLQSVASEQAEQFIVAYEPVWAIGTGKTATPEMAEAVHAKIRALLTDLIGAAAANKVRILYGGSMKPENADALLAQPNIDGGLIGGAALKASAFSSIIDAAIKLSR